MEHPLIGKLDHLTLDELIQEMSALRKKLDFAVSTGNGHLCNQLRMALESYQNKYQDKLKESSKRQDGEIDFGEKINIK